MVCNSDGMFAISCSYEANNYTFGLVNGKQACIVTSPVGMNAATFPRASIFVRKGMEISIDRISTGSGQFFPLV